MPANNDTSSPHYNSLGTLYIRLCTASKSLPPTSTADMALLWPNYQAYFTLGWVRSHTPTSTSPSTCSSSVVSEVYNRKDDQRPDPFSNNKDNHIEEILFQASLSAAHLLARPFTPSLAQLIEGWSQTQSRPPCPLPSGYIPGTEWSSHMKGSPTTTADHPQGKSGWPTPTSAQGRTPAPYQPTQTKWPSLSTPPPLPQPSPSCSLSSPPP